MRFRFDVILVEMFLHQGFLEVEGPHLDLKGKFSSRGIKQSLI